MYSIIEGILSLLQITFIAIQIRYMQNESIMTKISILSIFLQCVLDSVIGVAHFVFLPFVSKENQSSSFVFVFILHLIIFGILEMRILVSIYRSRYVSVSIYLYLYL